MSWWKKKKKKVKILTDKRREEMDTEFAEQEAQKKRKRSEPKTTCGSIKTQVCEKKDAFQPRISDSIPDKR